jgi:AraC-like DNA-binding protein
MEVQKLKARRIQILTFAGFLICVLSGVFISFRMGRRGYQLQTKLSNNLQTLRKYYLYTLLEKPFDPAKDKEDMKRYELNLPGDRFLAALFKGADRFFLQRFREKVGGNFAVEVTDVGQVPAAIISWQGEKENAAALLEDAIEDAQQDRALSVSAALGDVHAGPEGIYYSNQEAMEALQYIDTQNGHIILHYRDIKYAGASYKYPLEIEQRLINLIRLGDEENSLALLRQVLDDNSSPEGLPAYMTGILASDILGTLMKGRTTNRAPVVSVVPETLTAKELPRFLETTLAAICRANRMDLEEKKSRQWGEKIKTYINENFKSPDLNISITALHFDVTPAYLSGVFREETGLNLLEYINALRVEEAKNLLKQGHSIIRTAELCGFRGSSTFIRIFRKTTGVTPGQYKDIE